MKFGSPSTHYHMKNTSAVAKMCMVGLALLFAIPSALAQKSIAGLVTDENNGEPLIGANIIIKGTGTGTATDIDGRYSLHVPAEAVLVFSYSGYQNREIAVGEEGVIDIALVAGEILEEVVVIGYGTIDREDATGSVQSVSAEQFNRGAITGAQELLAGKVSGVIITTDGSPGARSAIRIRGESSLGAANDPLIVIDGVPIEANGVSGSRNPLNVLNPNDIETFTVLKDASASAIYGNRAAGGVILITTKKGKIGEQFKVGYSGNISIGRAANRVDVLETNQFRSLVGERYDADHPAPSLLGSADTDWQEEVYQTAFGHDQNLYLSGAAGNLPFRISLGYSDKNGILRTDRFKRVTAGLNLNPGFFDNTLQVNIHLKGMQSNNRFADRGAIGNALNLDPTQPVRDPSSPYGGFFTWTIPNGNPNTLAPTNPLALLELKRDESTVKRLITNVGLDYRLPFLPALRANLALAYDYTKGEGTTNVPTSASFAFDALNGGGVDNRFEQTKQNTLLEFYLNYKKTLGENHDLDLMAGYSWQHFEVGNSFRNSDVAGTPSETTEGADPAEYYLLSTYGRINYGFKDRYLLTLTVRRDGTSRFSPENRWGLFPAAALAIKLIDSDKKYLDNLKVRVGYGVTGQQDIGDFYAYLARYQLGFENARYQFGDDFVTTLRPNGYDSSIRWEETTTLNVGLDFSIVRDRLSGTIDIYQRDTKDLLNRIPVPAGTNLTNFVTTNIGSMENQGVEIAFFATPVSSKRVQWDLSANFAYNRNEITNLTAIDDPSYQGILTGGIAGGVGSNIQIHSVGFAPASFYVYEQILENGSIAEGQFVDQNGDGRINEQDKYRYEKPAANVTLGLTSKVQVGQFDLAFAGRAAMGNYVYNNIQTNIGFLDRLYNSTNILMNIHQSAVDLNVVDQGNLTFSDFFVKEASFFRMDHITLGYNSEKLLGKFSRIYITAQNPFVITGYDGLDPEIFEPNNDARFVKRGIDDNIYPRPRTFVFGINVEF